MKFIKINDFEFYVYIFSIKYSRENLIEDVKGILKKIQKILRLKGFYKVNVSLKSVGLFLKVVRLEDSFYKNTLDLKIEIDNDLDIYYKTNNYYLVCFSSFVYYYDGMFYVLVDESFDKIYEKVEFGDFVFGNDILDCLNKAIIV